MTVKELIKQLNKIEDQNLPVYVFDDSDIFDFSIDFDLTDRVDLNIKKDCELPIKRINK